MTDRRPLSDLQKVLLGGGMLRTVKRLDCTPWRGAAERPTDSPAPSTGRRDPRRAPRAAGP